MSAIFKREMKGYFTGVIGYAFLVIFLAIAAILFCYTTLFSMSANVSTYFGIALLMRSSAGNEYKMQSLPAFDIQIHATQHTAEQDSFGNDYDYSAVFPNTQINFVAKQTVTDKAENGALTQNVSVGEETSFYRAEVPAGVTLADNAETLDLKVTTVEKSEANITLGETEASLSVDVHVEGVAEDNNVPMQITLKKLLVPGLNDSNVKLYHVEDGSTILMTAVSTLA